MSVVLRKKEKIWSSESVSEHLTGSVYAGIRVATLIDSKFKLLMKRLGTDYYFQYPPAWDQLLLTGGSY